MLKKHFKKYSLRYHSIQTIVRIVFISLVLVSSVFITLLNIMGCSDMPHTSNMLTPEDFDRYLFAPDANTLCLTNGFESKCVTLVPKSGDPSLPIIHIYQTKITYIFYHKGVQVVRAERPRDDIVFPPVDDKGQGSGGNGVGPQDIVNGSTPGSENNGGSNNGTNNGGGNNNGNGNNSGNNNNGDGNNNNGDGNNNNGDGNNNNGDGNNNNGGGNNNNGNGNNNNGDINNNNGDGNNNNGDGNNNNGDGNNNNGDGNNDNGDGNNNNGDGNNDNGDGSNNNGDGNNNNGDGSNNNGDGNNNNGDIKNNDGGSTNNGGKNNNGNTKNNDGGSTNNGDTKNNDGGSTNNGGENNNRDTKNNDGGSTNNGGKNNNGNTKNNDGGSTNNGGENNNRDTKNNDGGSTNNGDGNNNNGDTKNNDGGSTNNGDGNNNGGSTNNGDGNNNNGGGNNNDDTKNNNGRVKTSLNNPNPSGHNPPDNVLSHLVYGHDEDNPEHKVGDGWIVWIFYPHNYVKDDNNDGIEDNPRGLGDNPIDPKTGPGTTEQPYGFTFSVSGGEVKSFVQTSGECTDELIGSPPTPGEVGTVDSRAPGQDNRDDSDDTPCNSSGSDYSTQMFVKSSADKITLTIRWTHGMYAPQIQSFNIMKEVSMKEYNEEGYDPGHLNQHRWEE